MYKRWPKEGVQDKNSKHGAGPVEEKSYGNAAHCAGLPSTKGGSPNCASAIMVADQEDPAHRPQPEQMTESQMEHCAQSSPGPRCASTDEQMQSCTLMMTMEQMQERITMMEEKLKQTTTLGMKWHQSALSGYAGTVDLALTLEEVCSTINAVQCDLRCLKQALVDHDCEQNAKANAAQEVISATRKRIDGMPEANIQRVHAQQTSNTSGGKARRERKNGTMPIGEK